MTVGVFGGSFNPVHNGHIALAEAIVGKGIVDEVWLTLSPLNPLKEHPDELVSDTDRMEMLRLATEGIPGLRACDIELSLPRPSYTINTLHALSAAYPDVRFRLVMGADNRIIFNKWKSHEEIERLYRPIVYPRPGFQCHEALDLDLYDISSTEIRRRVKTGESLNNLIPTGVLNYIRSHNLYR